MTARLSRYPLDPERDSTGGKIHFHHILRKRMSRNVAGDHALSYYTALSSRLSQTLRICTVR